MPGVNVTTAVRTGPVGTTDVVAGQVFMVGEAERGPTDEPTLLRSFNDYTTYYGNYESGSLYSHVKTFFDEGGSRCYVQRVVASDSAAGTLTLNDASGNATMVATAKNDGDWSDNLDIEIAAADVSGFKVKVYLDDALLLSTRDLTSVSDAINVVNSSAVSHLVVLSDDDTSDSDPATTTATPLSGGSDSATSAAVADSDIAAALATATTNITPNLGTGAICAPGRTGTTVWEALRDHAEEYNRIAILSFASGASASSARSSASAYYADSKASYMGFYWPHVKVPAPNASELATDQASVAGATVTISPESFVAGARARAVQQSGGPWRAGAGQISQAKTVSALAQDVTAATGETMDAARVNVLRKIGNGIRVYGARSVSNDEANWRYITMRDTMNYIVTGVEARMEEYVFETVDARGNLFGRIRGSIKAFLEPIRAAGGLYEAFDDDGVMIDPGYNVVVDSTINPATQLANGLVKAQVGVRVSGVADLIDIVITKSNLSAPVI
jgi:hypothetical protein